AASAARLPAASRARSEWCRGVRAQDGVRTWVIQPFSVERAGDGLGGFDVGAVSNELDGVLELGRQVAVRAGALDVLPQYGLGGFRCRGRGERCAQVERAGGGEDLDREHPL